MELDLRYDHPRHQVAGIAWREVRKWDNHVRVVRGDARAEGPGVVGSHWMRAVPSLEVRCASGGHEGEATRVDQSLQEGVNVSDIAGKVDVDPRRKWRAVTSAPTAECACVALASKPLYEGMGESSTARDGPRKDGSAERSQIPEVCEAHRVGRVEYDNAAELGPAGVVDLGPSQCDRGW